MGFGLWRIAFVLAVTLLFLCGALFRGDPTTTRAGQHLRRTFSRTQKPLGADGKSVSCSRPPTDRWDILPEECKAGVKTAQVQDFKSANQTLLPFVFQPLSLTSIKPLGWLRDQLDLMANGLPGHELDFYRIVRDNPWLGGDQEYAALNEAFPYWFNGLVPLAYNSNNERLKVQVLTAAEYIIGHQQEDGWLGPETDLSRRNFWGTYPVFLALGQLVEAESSLPVQHAVTRAMHRFIDLMHSMLSNDYQGFVWHSGDNFDEQWGRSRAADMIVALQWLYEKNPMDNEEKILDCMRYMYEKAYDWSYWFSEDVFIREDLDTAPIELTNRLFPYIHGVNAGQGLKAGAAIRRLTHNDSLLASTRNGVNWTFLYHGTPSGGIIADEREAGLDPSRGVELCSVVETMFSLSYLYQTIGDKDFADRCELAAFNALPVMVMPDWWAHQYVAQTNQPYAHELDRSPFWNVGPLGQTFGMQPNYPCCTVDFPQGYPKFVSALFARHGRHGIAHTLLAPAEVTTTTESGTNVTIRCDTNYPFNHVLYYTVEADDAFTFSVRIPTWSVLNQTTVSLNGGSEMLVKPDKATGMHDLNLGSGTNVLVVKLHAEIRVEPRANSTIAIYHGALLYAVPLNAHVQALPTRDYPTAPPQAQDFVLSPMSPWALAIDPSTLVFYGYDNRDDEQLPNPIWAANAPPVTISALACEIEWEMVDGSAAIPPKPGHRNCTSRAFTVGLTPYGAAKLHMAELPTVDLSSPSQEVPHLQAGDVNPGVDEL